MNLKREQAYEGTYVIQTEEPQLRPVEAVTIYKELSEVERAFANLKDVIEMRPIYHQTDARVQAHIFVAALAFLLHRAIEKKLKARGWICRPPRPCRSSARSESWTSPWAEASASDP